MPAVAVRLPVRRPELVIRPLGEEGRYVVKDPRRGAYFHFGEQEHFLLMQLDGDRDVESICGAFEQQFGESLIPDDLREFIVMAGQRGLLNPVAVENRSAVGASLDETLPQQRADARRSPERSQSLLYWRKRLFDPDVLFDRLEPALRFCWTRGFLLLSAGCIAVAMFVFWTGRHEVAASLAHAFRWESLLWGWLMVLAVTALHESAHGLTCKHFGGEVREIGFLLMFFMPCFYCNVSDAWLFREKSKRLWVTLAGGYFELFVWAQSVFVWRLTIPGSFPNYLAFLVLVSSGIESLFNFNPLIKLDGYYLLSDWLEVPNLRQRSWEYTMGHLRWLLWGAARPRSQPRGRLLLGFGLTSWAYSVLFVGLTLLGLFHYLGTKWGLGGMAAVALLGVMTTRNLFSGLSAGEVSTMIRLRHKRTAGWTLVLAALCGLGFLEVEDRAAGPFTLRSRTRLEVQAPAAGFLRQIYVDEGDCVAAGMVLARIEVPELTARLAAKRAERDAESARLALLEAGTRPEEIDAQRRRVEQATATWELAARHLGQSRAAHAAESERLAQQIALAEAELKSAESELARAESLRAENALSASAFDAAAAQRDICRARLQQAVAAHAAQQAAGVLEAEQDLSDREWEHVESCAALILMEAGTRPEEIAAQQARVRQLEAEISELEATAAKQTIVAPLSGIVMTPHVADRLGQYLPQGATICEIADAEQLVAEIALPEDAVRRVQVQQAVRLRPRGLTSEAPNTQVLRIAPVAHSDGEERAANLPGTVTVACEVDSIEGRLRPGMTGRARIDTGRRSMAAIACDRMRHYLRTEFWW